MRELLLIFVESSISTPPSTIVDHPAIAKYAKKRGKDPKFIILDMSYHYAAIKKLPDMNKRGRPDIVHISLLEVMGSPLNKMGKLRVWVHTVDDYVIHIDPTTRLPRNYIRFVGLLEQLFEVGKVPPDAEKPLLRLEKKRLEALLQELKPTRVFLMSEKGKRVRFKEVCEAIVREERPAVLIGGFQSGDFREEVYKLADAVYSVWDEALEAWVVASHIVTITEYLLGIV